MTASPRPNGKVKEITSAANPLIKQLRALSLKKYRERTHLFMAEGLKLVWEGLEQGFMIETLILSSSVLTHDLASKAAARTVAQGGLVIKTNDKIMASLTRRDNPQMVVGVFRQNWHKLHDAHFAAEDLYVALDRVRDPGNLGTIIRTCDAVDVKGVILLGETSDPYSLEAVRATMGSIFAVKLFRLNEVEFLQWKQEGGKQEGRRGNFNGKLIGTHLKGAVDYRRGSYQKGPLILLMGNEQQGLSEALAHSCDELVMIAQRGQADSLNLAVATGIMLYEMRRHVL